MYLFKNFTPAPLLKKGEGCQTSKLFLFYNFVISVIIAPGNKSLFLICESAPEKLPVDQKNDHWIKYLFLINT